MEQVGDKPEEVRKHLEEEQPQPKKKQSLQDAQREGSDSTDEAATKDAIDRE